MYADRRSVTPVCEPMREYFMFEHYPVKVPAAMFEDTKWVKEEAQILKGS